MEDLGQTAAFSQQLQSHRGQAAATLLCENPDAIPRTRPRLAGRLVFSQTQGTEFTNFNAGPAQGAAFFDRDLFTHKFQDVERAHFQALPTAGAFI
jgi:hypothetical protein